MTVVIDVAALTGGRARAALVPDYEAASRLRAGLGRDVVLTGAGPVWLYLRLAHALHGVARSLTYRSPVVGDMVVFDHSAD